MMDISEKMKELGLQCPMIELTETEIVEHICDGEDVEMTNLIAIVDIYYKIIRLELLSFERSKTGVPGYIDVKAINLESFEILKKEFPEIGMKLVENE